MFTKTRIISEYGRARKRRIGRCCSRSERFMNKHEMNKFLENNAKVVYLSAVARNLSELHGPAIRLGPPDLRSGQ